MKQICTTLLLCLYTFTSALCGAQENENLMKSEIEHVVILMLENRSFDNVLAWLYDKDESPLHFIPADTEPTYFGLSEETLDLYTNHLKSSSGEIIYSSPPIKGIPSVDTSRFINSPQTDPLEPFPHVTHQIYGFEGGSQPLMTGFLQDYASLWNEDDWLAQKNTICAVMETYTYQDLPTLHHLAKHYAVSDLWFSSVPTQTNPNRAFTFCGTSEGEVVNGSFDKNLFHADTLWNRFVDESPATSWTIFWQSDMTPILFPGPFSGLNSFDSLKRISNLDAHFQRMDQFHEQARRGQLPHISFLEPQWTMSVMADEQLIGMQGNDLHPPGDIRPAENFLANIYTSLIANQKAWEKTLLIITFDEHGGLFDHIPPPSAVPPDDRFQNGFQFDRYGVRVPTLFISPKIDKKSIVRSDNPMIPFDHTSLISTLLDWKAIDKSRWNMGKRVDSAPTFDGVITLTEPRQDSVLTFNPLDLKNEAPVVKMGDPFCLRDQQGNYIIVNEISQTPFLGTAEDKATLQFGNGEGNITHGSFIILQAQEACLQDSNLLATSLLNYDCSFSSNNHSSNQWWTIKSVDTPFVGADIHYGDKIYLENHVYVDLIQYVPCRLTPHNEFFDQGLTTTPITEEDTKEHYWIIEPLQ